MQRPVVCVGVLVQRPSGEVLLVQTTKWRGLWGVPGGKVEWGEPLEAAARRELLEETGLGLGPMRQIQVQEAVLSPEFHVPAHMLLIDFWAQAEGQVTPNEEIVSWAWVSLDKAAQYPLNSFTRSLLQRVAAHPEQAWPQ